MEAFAEERKMSDRELLVLIGERTRVAGETIQRFEKEMVTRREFEEHKATHEDAHSKMVTHDQFKPVKDKAEAAISKKEFGPVQKIVYGFVGIVLTTIALALVGGLITQ